MGQAPLHDLECAITDTLIAPRLSPLAPILAALADCVCGELTDTGAGPTCWCGLWPGAEVSWDYCGECTGAHCGIGWVRVAAVFPYDVFPNAVIDDRCTRPLVAVIEAGALRCVPVPPDGELLDPDTMAMVALDQSADAFALRTALACCPGISVAMGTWVPVGPQGGCVGGFWTTYLPLD